MRAALLAAALGWCLPALAGQAWQVTVEQLARDSHLVVRGTVLRSTARLSADGRRVFTHVEVQPDALWKGQASGPVTVIVPGGVAGGIGQRVEGAPAFEPGEGVVLFLSRAEVGAYRVNGMAQGKYRVEDAEARPDLAHTNFRPVEVPAGERRAEPMPVAELERRVRAAP